MYILVCNDVSNAMSPPRMNIPFVVFSKYFKKVENAKEYVNFFPEKPITWKKSGKNWETPCIQDKNRVLIYRISPIKTED